MARENDIGRRTAAILLLVVLLACSAALIAPKYNNGHDTEFHVLRIEHLAKALRMGDWNPVLFPDANDGMGTVRRCFSAIF